MHWFLFIFLFIPAILVGQIPGKVIDAETHKPLSYVNIVDMRGNLVAVSNNTGNFYIPEKHRNGKMIATLLGYRNDTIVVREKNLQITLQPDEFNISEVVVSAPLLPSKLTETPGSISMISGESLKNNANVQVADDINRIPGVYMQNGAYNTNRLTIRGIGSRTPYSTNRIKAYFDNVPLTTGDGLTSIEDIDMENIGRIEVIKGPSSALYGSGLGGTLVLYPEYPDPGRFNADIKSMAGSYGLTNTAVQASFQQESYALANTYSYIQTKGFRENSNYKRHNYYLSGNVEVFGSDLDVLFLYQDVYANIPSSLNEDDFNQSPYKAASNWLAIKGFEEYRKMLSGINYSANLTSKLLLETSLFGKTYSGYESRPFNILDDRSYSFGTRNKITISSGFGLKTVLGFERYQEVFLWNIFETQGGTQGALSNKNRENRQYLNLFGLMEYKPFKKLVLNGGINQNYLNYRLEDKYDQDTVDHSGRYSYTPIFSPRFGFSYAASAGMNIYGSAGHGFSAPSVEEALLPEGNINPDLKPEQGYNLELGTRGQVFGSRLFYDVDYYWIFLNDLLVTKRVTEEIFTGINAGKTYHQGLEAFIQYRFFAEEPLDNKELNLTASYHLTKNKFIEFIDEGVDHSGNALPGIPRQKAYAQLFWQGKPGAFASLTSNYTGNQYMNDENTRQYQGYFKADIQIGYRGQFFDFVDARFFVKINNLLDEKYASMVLVNAPSFGGSAPRYYYPGKPRNFVAGMRLSF